MSEKLQIGQVLKAKEDYLKARAILELKIAIYLSGNNRVEISNDLNSLLLLHSNYLLELSLKVVRET